MSESEFRMAWQELKHADLFDARARLSIKDLRSIYENFNEFRLFLEHKPSLQGRLFVEIACATGELYRYMHRYHPEFTYRGFDISRPAVERARQKYPDGQFDLCKEDLSDVIALNLKPAVVFARDVVHHQPDNAFKYLERLLSISNEATILRLRTRDKGETILDPDLSCQWHYNHWVPYIVMNIDEVVDVICKTIPVRRIDIVKHYQQLGGHIGRYLPKECYYPETGTAETAVYIERTNREVTRPEIRVSSREDYTGPLASPLWLRAGRFLRRKLWNR